MKPYRSKRALPLRLLSGLIRLIGQLLKVWPVWAIVALIYSPVQPYLRWEYTYQDFGSHREYYQCTYLGIDGFRNLIYGGQCPIVITEGR